MRQGRRRLGRILSLRLDEWTMLLEAVATLVAVRVLLHLIEFSKVIGWIKRVDTSRADDWTRSRVERVAWLVDVAGRLTGMRCLPRSLTLARMLARRGLAADVRIGVQTADGRLKAHAWVEWMGCALNDSPRHLQEFVPFESAIGNHSNV